MEVQLVDEFMNDDLRESWEDILSRTTAGHAQLTYEWLGSWWEVFGHDKKLSLMTVVDGGRIVGIAPLIISKVIDKAGFAIRKLTFVGDGLTDYHDLVIANDRREETVRALFERIVRDKDRWDAIHFRNVRGDSPNLPIVRDILRETSLTIFERVNIRSPYVAIDRDWAKYYGSLSKSMRSDIRRQAKRLAGMGTVECVRFHDVADAAEVLDIIGLVHRKCRQAQGGGSLYDNTRWCRFASLILERFGARKFLDLVLLRLSGRVIAYYFGFVYDNVVSFWNTGFDPAFATVSPGKLLLHHAIQDSFREGYDEFDLMVGEEPYKLQWTSTVRPNYELFAFKNTMRSHLLRCYQVHKPFLKKIGAGIGARVRG